MPNPIPTQPNPTPLSFQFLYSNSKQTTQKRERERVIEREIKVSNEGKALNKTPTTAPPCPRPPLKIWLLTAAISAGYELSSGKNNTVNCRLLSYLDPPTAPNPSPVCHVATSDVIVDLSRNLYFRLFFPDNLNKKKEEKLSTIVFFHGGGFAMLSPTSWGYDALCRLSDVVVGGGKLVLGTEVASSSLIQSLAPLPILQPPPSPPFQSKP